MVSINIPNFDSILHCDAILRRNFATEICSYLRWIIENEHAVEDSKDVVETISKLGIIMTLLKSRWLFSLAAVATVLRPQFAFADSKPSRTSPEKYMYSNYRPIGKELKLRDNTQFYATGSTGNRKGAILIPDTMGWNAGRIRNIADYFGENGCFAVIPALLGASKDANDGKLNK